MPRAGYRKTASGPFLSCKCNKEIAVNRNSGGHNSIWKKVRTAHRIARKASQDSRLTAKDLQVVVAEPGLELHCSATPAPIHMSNLLKLKRRRPLQMDNDRKHASKSTTSRDTSWRFRRHPPNILCEILCNKHQKSRARWPKNRNILFQISKKSVNFPFGIVSFITSLTAHMTKFWPSLPKHSLNTKD